MDLLAYRLPALGATALAHVLPPPAPDAAPLPNAVRHPPRALAVVTQRHALAAFSTDRQALQQSGALARRAFLPVGTHRVGVVAQELDVVLELFPRHVGFVRITNERGPLFGRQSHHDVMTIGMLALPRTPKAEGASVARMMQHPQHA